MERVVASGSAALCMVGITTRSLSDGGLPATHAPVNTGCGATQNVDKMSNRDVVSRAAVDKNIILLLVFFLSLESA